MKRALRQRAVAKEAADHFRPFVVLDLQREAACDRQSAADDRVTAREAEVLIEQMHRAAVAVRDAG